MPLWAKIRNSRGLRLANTRNTAFETLGIRTLQISNITSTMNLGQYILKIKRICLYTCYPDIYFIDLNCIYV